MYTIFLIFLSIILGILSIIFTITICIYIINYWEYILSDDYFYNKSDKKSLIEIIKIKRDKINKELATKNEINDELYGKYLMLDEIIREFNIK